MLDIQKIREDFPILKRIIHGKPLIYLDNAATTQKPLQVLEKVKTFYLETNSNIHRGVHFLSEQSTLEYESARETVREFINAKTDHEIIFTKGTTDAINLVAYCFGEKFVEAGDEIIVSHTEHHSNIVPWQMLCERKGAVLKVIPVNEKSEIIYEEYEKLLSKKTKIVSVAQVSNAFGTIHDIRRIIKSAHQIGAKVLIDGAQGIQHIQTDVRELDCDFYAFSGHKIYAETGIGVLYAKRELLEEMPPYQGGGDMIKTVSFAKTVYADLPLKFEAGTANYVGAISLAEGIKYILNIGLNNIAEYEKELLEYGTQQLQNIPELKIYGTAENKASVISFLLKGIHHYDSGLILDKLGIAVRTGTHCAEPAMERFGIMGTVRASFSFYNTKSEIDVLCEGLNRVKKMFA